MQTIDDLFERFGGTGAVARAIGVKQSAASEMRRRGSIPVRYWPELIAAASRSDIAVDSDLLVQMHVAPTQSLVGVAPSSLEAAQ